MKRGEIWLVNLDPTIGSEIRKTRPAVIVNTDALGKLPLKVIVPITDWKNHYSIAQWMVKLIPAPQNGLSKVSSADCFQVRSVSEIRLTRKLGHLQQNQMDEIVQGLSAILQIR
ncbi:MAG TPA: type II toxin-antitoxin system PemK/MazF family toxin [Bacteroidia bacterium]|jgi:mRNA interferase MazF|nr:type II toxin-antitoxin system PemK/MazF family toxin [Bacteroidia bacterium]